MQNQMRYHNSNQSNSQSQSNAASAQSGASVPGVKILSTWLTRRPNLAKNSLRLL